MKTIELFAGIGGFRVAADDCNLETVWANDIDDRALKVYRDNHGEDSIVQGDINEMIDEIPDHDILTGGFPCQPFSKAGKKLGVDDYRGILFEAIVNVIENKKPNSFILENVNSILYMDKGNNFKTILHALVGEDYKVEWCVFNAMDFGLPQHRLRAIIVGSRCRSPLESYFFDKEYDEIADFGNWPRLLDHKGKFET